MRPRVHITGASGSGTTTLGAALAARLQVPHLDTDDFFWLPTDPPYTTRRPVETRLALMRRAMDGSAGWVVSGSLIGWGDPFIAEFDLVVFLYVPPEERLERILQRERRRYGREIEPGGRMHAQSAAFLDWARGYDRPGFDGRSLERHRSWLQRLPCPVVEISGAPTLEQSLSQATAALEEAQVGS